MLELPHVAVGAAIATKVGHPLLAIPLSFASHFVLDQIPHWNPHFYTETQKFGHPKKNSTLFALVDIGSAVVLGSVIALAALPNTGLALTILGCSLVSIAPDLIKSPYFFLKFRPKWLRDYVKFERSIQADTNFMAGMFTQALVVIASLLWILS
jgi:hypothetical protein